MHHGYHRSPVVIIIFSADSDGSVLPVKVTGSIRDSDPVIKMVTLDDSPIESPVFSCGRIGEYLIHIRAPQRAVITVHSLF